MNSIQTTKILQYWHCDLHLEYTMLKDKYNTNTISILLFISYLHIE